MWKDFVSLVIYFVICENPLVYLLLLRCIMGFVCVFFHFILSISENLFRSMPGLFRLNLLSVTIFAFCFLNGHVFPFFIHTQMFIAWFAFKFVFVWCVFSFFVLSYFHVNMGPGIPLKLFY